MGLYKWEYLPVVWISPVIEKEPAGLVLITVHGPLE